MRRLPSFLALRAFEAAARLGGFTQAATELHVTPSAISHQVRALESWFNRPLFVRSVRQIQLTDEGARLLAQLSNVAAPNLVWVTDITYIRTHEGWLYLAVVVDLFSRQVVGWSMDSRMNKDLVLQALLAAVWRRKPKQPVMVHSDQGSQFTSYEYGVFLANHNLQPSMSRRGNCHDNAVAESFFQLLKRERIKRNIYKTREHARQDIFDYIEMFYNPVRRHSHAANLSPVNYEQQYFSEATNCL